MRSAAWILGLAAMLSLMVPEVTCGPVFDQIPASGACSGYPDPIEACPANYEPVCTNNGLQYGNICSLCWAVQMSNLAVETFFVYGECSRKKIHL
ncbi:ovomucoid-like [Patiria miniata]|uniref:Kazal-like domain-containing protein n=1 Tax=Patiria miniata TaxID=46514 RepID=A0A914BKZ8_PATMI|nr:ovomucoid-like [Patiria miniata]